MVCVTGTISSTMKNEQVLDKLQVERERGITVKAQTASLIYEYNGTTYLLNLIDTPVRLHFQLYLRFIHPKVSICACVRACVRACVCACMHACAYVRLSMCVHLSFIFVRQLIILHYVFCNYPKVC